MKTYFRPLLSIFSFCLFLFSAVSLVHAEDIDIFIGDSGGADYPNVLIVIDNSSNWGANNQGWPKDPAAPTGCGEDCNSKQGYYELKSIRNVLSTLPRNLAGDIEANVGLMMFNNSTASRDGGYIRSAIKKMTTGNRDALIKQIDEIIANFNKETSGASLQYTAALFDAFKYFGGYTDVVHATKNSPPSASPTFETIAIFDQSFWGSNNADGSKPDFGDAYNGSLYKSPVQTTCGKNYIIFIGNGFPASESSNADLRNVVKYLNDAGNPLSTITEFPIANYSCSGSWTDVGTCSSSFDACEKVKPGDSPSALYQCARSSQCNGNERIVQQCTSVTASFTTPSAQSSNRFADEFTDFLFKTDVSATAGKQNVFTYAIDVFKDQPDLNQTALLRNMAKYGGGQYYTANNEGAIVDALKEAFAEITSVNSTFASASLPVNATNRTQNENQVFIAMFRPDPAVKPRWFGNLKRYQLVNDAGIIELGDAFGSLAVNNQTGFIKDCAISFWTTDSGDYWKDYTISPSPVSACATLTGSEYSDSPDGPRVESGAVAEVIRKGNQPTGTTDWKVRRTVYGTGSIVSTSLKLLDELSVLSDSAPNLEDWVLGYDVGSDKSSGYNKENAIGDKETRASIHGDVVHSRPLPVNYGAGNVVVYYGANDGMLRAVDATTGKEKWVFLPYEFSARMQRLQDNEPKISFPHVSTSIIPTPKPKDYFWDGTMGVYQNADNSNVVIYPTMRRGGRMIYALNVTDSDKPEIKWKIGCPNLANDDDCIGDGDYKLFGQTWSTPNVAFIKEYSKTTPVLVVGGGYDKCEDINAFPSAVCAEKGRGVYIINAESGALIKKFDTDSSVAADVALIDVDNDSYVDFAYAVDTRGNIYRINFMDATTNTALASDAWTKTKVAYTNGGGRKFLYPPALLQASGGKVYLAIGSGDRERPLMEDYPFAGVTNRFYVFLDDTKSTSTNNLDDSSTMFNNTAVTGCSADRLLPDSTQKGWFMNLDQNGKGEQAVGSAVIVGGLVTFSTNRPVPATDGSCSTALGEARGYWVNLFNASGAIGVSGSCDGSRSSIFVGGGLPPSPVLGTVPIDGKPTTVVIGAPQKQGGASSQYSPQQVKPLIKSKRKMKYWKSSGDK
jgi:type IV pilus assembly protein PilY1